MSKQEDERIIVRLLAASAVLSFAIAVGCATGAIALGHHHKLLASLLLVVALVFGLGGEGLKKACDEVGNESTDTDQEEE